MSDLHVALGEIRGIRRQLAQSTQFRGYGPATLAATGAVALVAAGLQAWLVPAAKLQMHPAGYLAVWLPTAAVCGSITGVQMVRRTQRMNSGLSNEMLRMAVEQFLPAVGTGLLLTLVLLRCAPAVLWMLPGLWQLLYSLGVFSSCRFLPRQLMAAGAWYLLTGLACLSLGDARALAPWTMGLAFGVGQALMAGILYLYGPQAEEGEHGV